MEALINGHDSFLPLGMKHAPLQKVFPQGTRKDETFDIQSVNSNAWRTLELNRKRRLSHWFLFALMGLVTGFIAFSMERLTQFLVDLRHNMTQAYLENGSPLVLGWAVFSLYSTFLVGISVTISLYYGPGAIGSGVAETMGVVNGVNYWEFLGVNTLITKIVGVVFAVAGGLRVGKEGPLAHIGSLVGVACLYIPWGLSKPFRNDRDKRDFIAAGAGVGCAVAFGAPIGGVLYAYEVSKANTFWTFSLAWQTFLATALANFTLTFCNALTTGNFTNVTNAGLIRLGEISKNNNYNLADVFVFIFIGILGGLFGALFNEINIRLAKLRIKHLKTKIAKYFEAILFAFVGSTIIFYLPALFPCTEFPLDTEIGTRYQCPEDQVNEMATLLFNTEGDTLKYLLKAANNSDFMVALTFLLVWFFFTATTYGVSVPSGLFFPGLLIGASLGEFVGRFLLLAGLLQESDMHDLTTYAIVGGVAILAGYCRLSFCLSVLMMETT
jgi:chloride channel 7